MRWKNVDALDWNSRQDQTQAMKREVVVRG